MAHEPYAKFTVKLELRCECGELEEFTGDTKKEAIIEAVGADWSLKREPRCPACTPDPSKIH